MAHSKRNTSLAFFTSHERSLLKSTWGSQSTRLSRDSFLPFASCQLCLEIARDPVACSFNGDIFCRECAVSNLLAQRKEIKRLEKEEERRRKEELEGEVEKGEEEKERAIIEFEKVMMGLEGGVKKQGGKAVGDKDGETERKGDRGSKRKFELDEEEMLKNARAERAKARKVLDEEKSSKPTLPSFWVPSLTPSSKTANSFPKAVKLSPLCPSSSSSIAHPLSLKSLVSIKFTTSEATSSTADTSALICPACKKGLSNTLKAMLTIPCGHVLCKPCAGKFMSSRKGFPDPHANSELDTHITCYVCEADLSGKVASKNDKEVSKGTSKDIVRSGLVQINSEGTGFAGGGSRSESETQGIVTCASSTMSFNYGASDIVALFTLVAKLYNDVYVPARAAPKARQELIKELAALKDVLSTLADDTKSKTFQQRLGERRKRTLNRCLLNCGETLAKLDKLVEKHRNPSGSLWGGIKWVGIKGEVTELKSKISVYSAHLSLCLSTIGNSTLLRLESSLDTALTRIPENPSDDEDEEYLSNPLTHTISEPKGTVVDRKAGVVSGLNGRRLTTGSHIANPGMNGFPEYAPLLSEDGQSEFGVSGAQVQNGEPMQGDGSVVPANGIHSNEESAAELVASVLRIMREKEAPLHRPLRHDRARIKNHQPNEVLAAKFQRHVNDELERHNRLSSTFTTKKWLRISTWWLLKAKHTRQECERYAPTDASLSLSVYGKSSANQAYVDSLKASWILDTIILGKEDLLSLQIPENRKLVQDLINAVSNECSLYKPIDTPEKVELMEQNHYIIDEEHFRSDDILTAWTDDGRWITVEQDDAGEEEEKVLFRTFVNASIGSRRTRIRSEGAPYMLLLYTKKSESELQVTISNQSGSCGLNRSFTNEDLQNCDEITSSISHKGTLSEVIELNFNNVKVEIFFTNESDLKEFIRIPRTYFQAVRHREPRQLAEATETVIFQRSVKYFQQLKASTLEPLAPEKRFESCDLRVLETTTKQAWETVRRIVISSSAGEKKHWCKDFFLPLSGVQIRREHENQFATMVKWSDCTCETTGTDGNYNKVYSYIYRERTPNVALSLRFRNVGDADDFETAILRLTSPPIFSWPSTISPTHFVHTVSDTGENAKNYRAILLIRTRHGWRFSALLYVYRHTDFQYSRATKQFQLQFHQAYYTHYVSNHLGHTFLPKEPPHFEKCEKRLCSEKSDRLDDSPIEFDDEVDCMRFLSSISSSHKMIFSRQARFISTKLPSKFRFGSNKGPADVQLWQRGNSVRLLMRWVQGVEVKWISMTVPPEGMDRQGGSYRAILPKVDYQRGRKVNMLHMEATDPSPRTDGKKSGPIVIGFENANDETDFSAALKRALKQMLDPFAGEPDSRSSEISLPEALI